MNSSQPFMNIIKKVLLKISASKVHEEYQQIKTLQLAQFFKFSLAIIILSIVYFIVPTVIQRNPSYLPWLCVIIVPCLLGWYFCDRLKKYLDIILFILCIALFANEYDGIYPMAFSTTYGTFALGFAFGHSSGTFEMILGLRFSNFYFKITFYLIILVIRMIIIHQIPIHMQIYHVYIIIIGLIVASQKEREDMNLFQRFHDYRESLTKFKNLVSSGLSANLLILTKDLKQELFISDPLAEMARTAEQKEEIHNVLQWLDQLIIERTNHQDLPQQNEHMKQSVLSILKEMGSRASFLRNQNKLAFNAKIQEDGTHKIFEIKVISTIWDDKDALVLILNDITDHYLNINLQVADRNKDKMLAMISHELRTPLNGILGVVNILKKDIKEPQQLRYLTVCHNSGELLLNLVNSILDLQQIRDHKFSLKFTKEDLYELLGSIYDLFKFQYDQKDLYLKLEISPKVSEQIITDKNRLKQILINLIGNALKFTFKGGVSVFVDIDPVFDGYLHFRVSDTGIGIKEEDLQKLFKMYGRLEQQNTQGVGFGLEISNQLAKLLAAGKEASDIKVESQVGEGTTFSFSIRYDFNDEGHEIDYYEPRVFSEDIEDVGLKITPYSQKDIFCNDRANPLHITSSLRASSENLAPKSLMPTVSLFSSQKLSDLSPIMLAKKQSRSYNNLHRSRDCFSPRRTNRKWNTSAKSKILLVDDNPFNPSMGGVFQEENFPVKSPLKNHPEIFAWWPHIETPDTKYPRNDVWNEIIDERHEKEDRMTNVDQYSNPALGRVNLLVARQIVERLGYTVETALNGELALEQVRACVSSMNLQCFSAILMDLQMPVMDGFEATKELRKMMINQEIREIPIIAVSANDTEDDKKKCKEVGMYEHLSKPLYENLLRKVLKKALKKEAADMAFEETDEVH